MLENTVFTCYPEEMRSIAQLVLFFTICFLVIFIGAGMVRFLQLSVDAAKAIPAKSPVTLPELIAAIRKLLPLALYFTILLALSYTVRRSISFLPAFITLFILAGVFTFGSVWGLLRAANLRPIPVPGFSSAQTLGSKGLILSQGNTTLVLLGNPGDGGGPRVIYRPGQSLIYQGEPAGPQNTAVPRTPFRTENARPTDGMFSDCSLAMNQLEYRFKSGLLSFGLYGGALILLLLSLRFTMNLSSWPMANLFSGAVVFRGVLAFEIFIDSQEIQSFLGALLGPRIPSFFISPIVFGGIGAIIIVYTLLVYSIQGKYPAKNRNKKRGR
jgi:hypothetical protein